MRHFGGGSQPLGKRQSECSRVVARDDVQLARRAVEQDVTHGSADKLDVLRALRGQREQLRASWQRLQAL